jgi:hypothetical protein
MDHLPAYVVDWELNQSEQGLEKFVAFLAAAGVKFEVSSDLRKILDVWKDAKPSVRVNPRSMFEEQLMLAANKTLGFAGDKRRLFRELGEVRKWRLMTPDEVKRAEESGMKLEKAGASFRRAMWTFGTIPVAIGTYFLSLNLLRERGVDENLAWLIALAAWFIVRQTLNRTLLRAR